MCHVFLQNHSFKSYNKIFLIFWIHCKWKSLNKAEAFVLNKLCKQWQLHLTTERQANKQTKAFQSWRELPQSIDRKTAANFSWLSLIFSPRDQLPCAFPTEKGKRQLAAICFHKEIINRLLRLGHILRIYTWVPGKGFGPKSPWVKKLQASPYSHMSTVSWNR